VKLEADSYQQIDNSHLHRYNFLEKTNVLEEEACQCNCATSDASPINEAQNNGDLHVRSVTPLCRSYHSFKEKEWYDETPNTNFIEKLTKCNDYAADEDNFSVDAESSQDVPSCVYVHFQNDEEDDEVISTSEDDDSSCSGSSEEGISIDNEERARIFSEMVDFSCRSQYMTENRSTVGPEQYRKFEETEGNFMVDVFSKSIH